MILLNSPHFFKSNQVNEFCSINANFNNAIDRIPLNASVLGSHDWHYPQQPRLIDEDNPELDEQIDVLVAEPELAKPPMYAVVLYNDDYTPMDFVVYILQSEFKHNVDRAVEIMLNIHNNGRGIAGIYPKDIAETKAKKVNVSAEKEGYPLLTQIEPHQDS